MKLKCPDTITGHPMIDGKVYLADKRRIIDVLDENVHEGLFARGFVRVLDDGAVAAAVKPGKFETPDKGN